MRIRCTRCRDLSPFKDPCKWCRALDDIQANIRKRLLAGESMNDIRAMIAERIATK